MNQSETAAGETVPNFQAWEKAKTLCRWVEIKRENILRTRNSRMTTRWGVLELAKRILESGGWHETEMFRFKLLNEEDFNR